MSVYITRIFELIFMPPGLFISLLLLTVLLVKNLRILKLLLLVQVMLIYALSTPVMTHHLYRLLGTVPVLSQPQINKLDNDVIIILAGGIRSSAKEYDNKPDLGYFTLLRLRYGAWLQKQTGLPVIVTGGIRRKGISEAERMKQVLEQEFQVQANIFVEQQSSNTLENAIFSRLIMQQHQFNRPLLVTSAFHMRRALLVFNPLIKNITPAPMDFMSAEIDYTAGDFIPNSKSLWQNYLALHELIGYGWYKIRLQLDKPPSEEGGT